MTILITTIVYFIYRYCHCLNYSYCYSIFFKIIFRCSLSITHLGWQMHQPKHVC